MHASSSLSQIYTPKLYTALRNGHSLADFRADLVAGLTVAIPLSAALVRHEGDEAAARAAIAAGDA